MKLLYDHQIFSLQKYGGVSRYFYELIKNFESQGEIEVETPILSTNNEYIQSMVNSKKSSPFLKLRGEETYKRKQYKLNRDHTKKILEKENFDLFHPTYYDNYFLKVLKKPFVLTVFDMIHEQYPEFYSPKDPTAFRKKQLLSEAQKIIAISEHTKNDIIKFYGISEDRVKVIHLANSLRFQKEKSKRSQEKPYLLFVGRRDLYKNFYFFIQSTTDFLRENGISVICTGSPFSDGEIEFFKNLKLEELLYHQFAVDEELAALYHHALAFVFPSYYEGFGFPVLEAFACECPVIACRATSIPEVAGNAALYFEPKGPHSILNALKEVLKLDREICVKKGLEQLKKFSWTKTAKETLDVYKSV